MSDSSSPEIIFSTIHGSHLYGLANEHSDKDVFYVTTSLRAKARHSYNELGWDQARVGLDTFLRRIQEGSHQSVEALFSPYKQWNPDYDYLRPMLEAYRVTGSEVFAKYERTIKKFCYGDFKRRRHAVRLAFNLDDLRAEGRFNPVMDPYRRDVAGTWAEMYEGDDLAMRLFR